MNRNYGNYGDSARNRTRRLVMNVIKCTVTVIDVISSPHQIIAITGHQTLGSIGGSQELQVANETGRDYG
jgi:hypothetical protein